MSPKIYARKLISLATLSDQINSLLLCWSEQDFDPEDTYTIKELHKLSKERHQLAEELSEATVCKSHPEIQRAFRAIELGAI